MGKEGKKKINAQYKHKDTELLTQAEVVNKED